MRFFLNFVFVLFISSVHASSNCDNHYLPCEDGGCIESELWCDTHVDCSDGSDEKYCNQSSYSNIDPNNCPSNYFRCLNGHCIPMAGRCDGFPSCSDFSDEKLCDDTLPAMSKTATRTATNQTLTQAELHSPRFSVSPGAAQQSFDIMYSDFGHSDFPNQLEKALKWLLSQRRSDFGWGVETPRALTALYLSDEKRSIDRDENDMLMIKQLEVQLSLDMARNGTKTMKLTDLALYTNALLASCKDPKNFYGENLVNTMRNGVNTAYRERVFVNPSVYLALCLNNASIHEDTQKLHEIIYSGSHDFGRIDIQALALLTIECINRNTDYLGSTAYDGLRKRFIQRTSPSKLPGNVYEASLLFQALQPLEVTIAGLMEFILKQQLEDGSFGSILATYLALPVLSGRSFLQITDHCDQEYSADPSPIEVLKNAKRRKISVQYSLNYGYPVEMTETIQMKVAEGINFLDVMRLAQEINPKFKFMLDDNREDPVVYSIGGIPNDAEKGMFWTLYVASAIRARGDSGRLAPYSGNIKLLAPHPGDEFVYWLRYL